ncbi:GD10659 [Drosophila simulans]|uniref:Protein Wnt n=1 Tax=Drosophila simulans TaxID=7240 RepID=B4QH98_DROSI|nr:GD10659 [Drosophila simulans]
MWKIHNKLLIYILWIMEIRLVSSFTSAMLCGRIPGLTPGQRNMCREMPDALIALGEGHQLGAQECQHQFRGHRWNCSEVWQRNVFAHVIPTASREAAYTYAIASAGAAYAVTAACARGNISTCGCDVRHKATPTGGGTPDEPGRGRLLGGRGLGSVCPDLDALIGRTPRYDCHTGRRVEKYILGYYIIFFMVKDSLLKVSKKPKTVQAVKGKRGLRLVLSRKKHAGTARAQKPVLDWPKRMELIYLEASPNYCERSLQTGSQGTSGRTCQRTGHGPQSCDLLCCGRGHNTQHIRRTTQCRCQFRWCCEVKCDECDESYEEFTCK